MDTVKTSIQFSEAFNKYCAWHDLTYDEINDIKKIIRSDIAKYDSWYIVQIEIIEWMEAKWGGIPTCDMLRDYADSVGYFHDMKNEGIMCSLGKIYDHLKSNKY